jgi:S-adenosylmethionine decarboxylase
MNKLTAPTVICADANETGKDPGGITGFVLISESHISIHTFADRGFFTMDVYSCRNFEDQIPTVLKYVNSVFPYEHYEIHTVKRGLEYPTAAIEKNRRLVSLTGASPK